jgi:hypothetical protein
MTTPLSPFKCEWKEMVKTILPNKGRIEAIRWLRDYSRRNPEPFGPEAMRNALDGKPSGLGLKEAKDLVESIPISK